MSSPFSEFLQRYQVDPVGFVRNVLGAEPQPWQAEILEVVAGPEEKRERKVSVASGHGVGKSTLASWCAIFFLICRHPVKIAATAPTSTQLDDVLMNEVKHWINQLPGGLKELLEYTQSRVFLKSAPESAFMRGATSRAETPEALQGIHSENVLLLCDESSGIPEQVFVAGYSSMTAPSCCTLLLSNPIRPEGFFFDTHHLRSADTWYKKTVSCFDVDRPGMEEYIEDMKNRYGEDSDVFRARVLGLFPRVNRDSVIPLDLVESSVERDVEVTQAPAIWGLDVARYGQDSSALCKRKGNHVTEPVRVWNQLDLMQLTGAVLKEFEEVKLDERPENIMIDSIGLGAGCYDRLNELIPGVPMAVNVSESPAVEGGRYLNLRAELWYQAREWFERGDCRIPIDGRLSGELTSPQYTYTSSGKLKVESKEDLKRRGLRSPDTGDAFILTFAYQAGFASGLGKGSAWGKPIRRRISGIV